MDTTTIANPIRTSLGRDSAEGSVIVNI